MLLAPSTVRATLIDRDRTRLADTLAVHDTLLVTDGLRGLREADGVIDCVTVSDPDMDSVSWGEDSGTQQHRHQCKHTPCMSRAHTIGSGGASSGSGGGGTSGETETDRN